MTRASSNLAGATNLIKWPCGEMADACDSKSHEVSHIGSNPVRATIYIWGVAKW